MFDPSNIISSAEKASSISTQNDSIILKINDQQEYRVYLRDLRKYPDTMLSTMIMSRLHSEQPIISLHLKENLNEDLIPLIIQYYHDGYITCPVTVDTEDVVTLCDYFMIPITLATIHATDITPILHYVSDQGARRKWIEEYMPECILPAVEECASLGARDAYLICLFEEDELDPAGALEDDELFVGGHSTTLSAVHEIYTRRVIRRTELAHFLNFIENRHLAKEVCEGRGFKKVKLGMEGYPVCDRQERDTGSLVFRYEQRPYIRLSWEKEVVRNKHVHFQVNKRPSSDFSSSDRMKLRFID
jgi:hypothetical protein